MGMSIRISDETKRKLETIKRDDESFDDLLDRLVGDRTSEMVKELAGFGGAGIETHMQRQRAAFDQAEADRTAETKTYLDGAQE